MKTKTEQLSKLPLWQCDECHRLEFSDATAGDDWNEEGELLPVGPTCPYCDIEMEAIEKDSNAMCEAIGQHFQRDTGLLRPGKDCRTYSPEYLANAFDAWNFA